MISVEGPPSVVAQLGLTSGHPPFADRVTHSIVSSRQLASVAALRWHFRLVGCHPVVNPIPFPFRVGNRLLAFCGPRL